MAYDAARQRVVLVGGFYDVDPPLPGTWLYGRLAWAATQPIGTACAGTSGRPVITSGLPFPGNEAFVLDLLSGRALAPCVFMLAPETQASQLGGGCTLYLKGPLVPVVAATNASGFASVKLGIPLDVALRGVTLYAQAFVADPQGPALGLTFSAGLRFVLGD